MDRRRIVIRSMISGLAVAALFVGVRLLEERVYADAGMASTLVVAAVLGFVVGAALGWWRSVSKEDDYRAAFDYAPVGMAFLGLDGAFLRVNQPLADMLGYTQEELAGRSFLEVTHPDDRDRSRSNYRLLTRGSVLDQFIEKRYVCKDGRVIWAKVTARLHFDVFGKPKCCISQAVNITAQKEMEDTLRQREEQYRLLVENQSDLIVEIDPEGRLQFVSRPFCDLFGKSEDELLGQHYTAFVHEEDRKVIDTHMQEVVKPPYTMRTEQRAYTAKGMRWLSWHNKAVLNEKDEVIAITAVGRDITEQKQAEEALRRQKEFAESLVDMAPEIVLVLDREGRIVRYNPFMEELSGYKLEDVRGKDWYETFVPERCRDEVLSRFSDAVTDRQVNIRGNTNPIVLKNGKEREIEWRSTTLTDAQGNLTGLLAIGHDITARNRLEAQLRHSQKMEAIGMLAGGIAHDFNNLLTAIFAYTHVARETLEPNHVAMGALDRVYEAATQASGITRSLVTFSRKTVEEKHVIDLRAVVMKSVELLSRVLPATVELSFEDEATDPLWVLADSSQLQQVVMNLAINARDAMPKGGKLRVALAEVSPPESEAIGGVAQLVVSDTGVGISSDVMDRIFDPFFTTKPHGEGTGLGLSIIHSLVKAHDGQIDVESTVGEGTTFTVRFPMTPPEQNEGEAAEADRTLRGDGETVLLAEQDRHIREIMATALEASGYGVLDVEDGESVLKAFQRHRAELHILVVDVDLPKRDGLECLKSVREMGSETPAILISARVDADLESQIDPYTVLLRKPFQIDDLRRLISAMMNRRTYSEEDVE